MPGTRLLLSALAALVLAAPAATADVFGRKGKTDAAKVKKLAETLKTDPDEAKRKAAAAELRDYDPRTHAELLPALIAALQRDASPAVRAEAAEGIGQFKPVTTVAGLALEAAADRDPAPAVRAAARQALWEYHLNGYRSGNRADGFLVQTAEPPVARPPAKKVVVAKPPAPPTQPVAAAVPPLPPPDPIAPADSAVPSVLPGAGPSVGPFAAAAPPLPPPDPLAMQPARPGTPLVLVTAVAPAELNVTSEPPLAKDPPPKPAPRPTPAAVVRPTVEPPPAPGPVAVPPLDLPALPPPPPPPILAPVGKR